jgi:ketosteroid isomerase-like protein
MSQENVEIVRRTWDAFLTADFQTALSFYAPDVEWDGTNLPDGQIGTGHEAILDHITRWAEAWDDWTVEVERVVEAGSDQASSLCAKGGEAPAG